MMHHTAADEVTQPLYTDLADIPLVPPSWPPHIPPAPHTITRWANRHRRRIRRQHRLRVTAVWTIATASILAVGYVLWAALVSTLLADALHTAAFIIGSSI